ncbi:hypothetical protein [Amycolatopsis sp. NPDC004169]|uniref:hypothetical protein n=1 Tax=Amycolatopsis sp. NPDC004169 TaxID=3154453 RepID=UPI0033B1CAF6
MENTLIVLLTAFAFSAGGLAATMVTSWWSRHRYDEARREPPRVGTRCRQPRACCCGGAH